MTDQPAVEQPAGPAADAFGRTVIDPSRNVDALVEAAVTRLDDLRDVWTSHVKEVLELRAQHYHELRILEAERINAIRAVDVAASQQQQKDAEIRATALAKQVADAAEQQRSQVAAAAAAAATSLGAALVPIQERLAELTRLQYEQQGQKAQVIETRDSTTEARAGSSLTVQIVAGVIGFFVFLLLLVGTIVSVYLATKK